MSYAELLAWRKNAMPEWLALDTNIQNMRRYPDVFTIHDIEALALKREAYRNLLEAIQERINELQATMQANSATY